MAGAFMIIESWLNERATNENRGTVFGLYMMVTYAAIMAGQMSVAFADVTTGTLFLLAGILFCASLISDRRLLGDFAAAAGRRLAGSQRSSLPTRRWPSLAAFLSAPPTAHGGTLGPVYGSRIGISNFEIALMIERGGAGGRGPAQLPVGRFSDRMDRRIVLAAAALGSALFALIIVRLRSAGRDNHHRADGPIWVTRLHALFDRRGARQRPRRSGRVRPGLGRTAAASMALGRCSVRCWALSLWTVCGPRASSWRPLSRTSLYAFTRHGACSAARRSRSTKREDFKTIPAERALTPQGSPCSIRARRQIKES